MHWGEGGIDLLPCLSFELLFAIAKVVRIFHIGVWFLCIIISQNICALLKLLLTPIFSYAIFSRGSGNKGGVFYPLVIYLGRLSSLIVFGFWTKGIHFSCCAVSLTHTPRRGLLVCVMGPFSSNLRGFDRHFRVLWNHGHLEKVRWLLYKFILLCPSRLALPWVGVVNNDPWFWIFASPYPDYRTDNLILFRLIILSFKTSWVDKGMILLNRWHHVSADIQLLRLLRWSLNLLPLKVQLILVKSSCNLVIMELLLYFKLSLINNQWSFRIIWWFLLWVIILFHGFLEVASIQKLILDCLVEVHNVTNLRLKWLLSTQGRLSLNQRSRFL